MKRLSASFIRSMRFPKKMIIGYDDPTFARNIVRFGLDADVGNIANRGYGNRRHFVTPRGTWGGVASLHRGIGGIPFESKDLADIVCLNCWTRGVGTEIEIDVAIIHD